MGTLFGQADAGPTRDLGPAWLEVALGGRVLQWYMCLPGLQPLAHCDPGQDGARVLDGSTETTNSAAWVLRKGAAAGGVNSGMHVCAFQTG